MTPARTIGPDKSYIDYYHGVIASRRGLQNCFGIRVNQHQCCAVIKIGDAHPFTYGKCYPLPVKIDTLSNPMRNTLDDHLMNDPSSDLLEVLSRRKSFLEAVNSPSEVEPQRMAATVKGTGNCISMTSECSERHLLALKVSESVAAVSAIKELQK